MDSKLELSAFLLQRSRYSMTLVGATVLVLLTLSACFARYDPVTYRRLTDLKPVALQSMLSFGTEAPDYSAESVILRMEQLYEYEKGKGDRNAETAEQVKKIKNIYVWSLHNRRKQRTPWTRQEVAARHRQLGAAFDAAIETEQKKQR